MTSDIIEFKPLGKPLGEPLHVALGVSFIAVEVVSVPTRGIQGNIL